MSLSIELNTAIEKVDDMSNKINSILQRLPSRKYVHAAENIQKGNLKAVVHLAEHTLAEQTLSILVLGNKRLIVFLNIRTNQEILLLVNIIIIFFHHVYYLLQMR